jgi:hypothetical protein
MTTLWVNAADRPKWVEPEEDDWRNARPNKYSQDPHKLYGQINHVDEYFGGHSTRPTPWKQAPTKKTQHQYDKDAVKACLQNPDHPLEDVDPRELRSTQPSIVRAAAQHYLSGEHERTGATFEAGGNIGNKHPVVFHDNDTGERTILTGHHRAFAALAEGRPLRARLVRGRKTPR